MFISVDPQRDSPEVLKEYLAEFHPRMLGLTGDAEAIKAVTKAYRVYYSAPPPKSDEIGDTGNDYLVDHSIFFFLMDPKGNFADYYGKNLTANEVAQSMRKHIRSYLHKT